MWNLAQESIDCASWRLVLVTLTTNQTNRIVNFTLLGLIDYTLLFQIKSVRKSTQLLTIIGPQSPDKQDITWSMPCGSCGLINMLTFDLAAAKTAYLTARRSYARCYYSIFRCTDADVAMVDVTSVLIITSSLHQSSQSYATQALGTKGTAPWPQNVCRNLAPKFPTYFCHSRL